MIVALLIASAFASTANRAESIAQAKVWQKPAWVHETAQGFAFDDVDLFKGPALDGWETALESSPVTCAVHPEDLQHASHGMTKKFYCSVDDTHGVKFKYKFEDGEIMSEIVATRLFWALGFGADRMYWIDQLNCTGCTEDPFTDRRIDPSANPRVFTSLAAERKFSDERLKGGWTFHELMSNPSRERDALRLLAVLVQHADNKPENQDVACFGQTTADGGCSGETFMLIQDLGATFGKGQIDATTMSKAIYPDWRDKPVWADAANCTANLGANAEAEMNAPQISEEARSFLARLLNAFTEGEAGRKRVQDLFRSGHADWRFGTIDEWTDTFIEKVHEITHPTGVDGFKCPKASAGA